MSIQIGTISLEGPVILAPMSGVTDLPFRRLVKQSGCGLVVSEMVASQAMIRENRQTLRMVECEPEQFPMAVQLAGCEPEVMAEAAKLNEDRGAAIIDINFGCPVKKVAVGQQADERLTDLDILANHDLPHLPGNRMNFGEHAYSESSPAPRQGVDFMRERGRAGRQRASAGAGGR